MSPPRTSQPTFSTTRTFILLLTFALSTFAQTTYVQGNFQAAVWASNGGGDTQDLTSPAKAQCPANFPQSCDSIGEGGYCCPSGSVCQYADNQQVGCCASSSGAKCSGSLSNGNAYQAPTTTTWAQQPTTWQQPATTENWNGAGGAAAGGYNQATTTVVEQQGGFCTTLVAQGDNLPTTANARCGTALVVEAGAGGLRDALVLGGGGGIAVVLLQVVGAWVVLRRG